MSQSNVWQRKPHTSGISNVWEWWECESKGDTKNWIFFLVHCQITEQNFHLSDLLPGLVGSSKANAIVFSGNTQIYSRLATILFSFHFLFQRPLDRRLLALSFKNHNLCIVGNTPVNWRYSNPAKIEEGPGLLKYCLAHIWIDPKTVF